MQILFLAPHPFYQDRGSPIADAMVLNLLSKRGNQVDVVTYPEGKDINYEHITLHRIPYIPFIRNIRPGFSWQKIIYDILMFFKAIRLILKKRYHFIHAVEESVFIALVFKAIFKIPYVYDMDSSLVEQLIEKYSFLSHFAFLLIIFEKKAVENAKVVVPVCDALAIYIKKYKPRNVVVISDISLLE